MPSTPESLLRTELQATGENATTWGIKTNNNIELLGQAIAGVANVNVGGSGNYTLVANNYVSDEARPATLVLTGTLSGSRDVIVPSSPKHYTIINQTSGAFPLTIRQVSGTGVAIPAGSSQIVCTSTTCVGVGTNNVLRAGDTMTGALGVIAGTVSAPGVFVSGDTNTGLFQPSPNTLSISVGGTEVARHGAGGFMRLASGTDAAPAYSFSGDTDTGIFNNGPNILAMAVGGYQAAYVSQSAFALDNKAGDVEVSYFARATDASASNVRATNFLSLNESSVPLTTIRSIINTDGSGNIELYATPAGSRASDRRVLRATIPGSGAINLVGPVNVSSSDLDVSGNLRFNSGYGSAAIAYGVRAWVNFNGIGTVAIRGSGGVTSITDNATGDYTINYNFTMPDANYSVVGNAGPDFATIAAGVFYAPVRTTTSVRVITSDNNTDQLFDYARVDVQIVR